MAVAPLIVVFERDDAIAVPLLSQLRMAGYDVRAARTPVELLGMLGKQLVALVLVDLGNATAGRREFWVALDAQRRGRSLQVMTFRFTTPVSALDPDLEPAARALADVEVRGAHELQKILDGVRQRVPLNGQMPGAAAPGGVPGAIPPIGSALGMPAPAQMTPPQFGAQPPFPMTHASALLGQQHGQQHGQQYGQQHGQQYGPQTVHPFAPQSPAPIVGPPTPVPPSSPFANPVAANPFTAAAESASPFAQPYNVNPFAAEATPAPTHTPPPFTSQAASPFGGPSQFNPPSQFGGPSRLNPPSQFGGPSQFGRPNTFGPATAGGNPYPTHGANAYAHDPWTPQPAYQPQFQPHEERRAVEDAWTPPEDDQMTGVVPEVAFQDYQRNHQQGYQHAAQSADYNAFRPASQPHAPRVDDAGMQGPTSPMPAVHVPSLGAHGERALSNVLVEGALLSPEKLEVLKGIQQMLSGVEMDFNLGELAMLFKFLSKDQLLAALLVSRGLVSPQQIAALGRVKQELAATGMEHDLSTLLQMFHVLPPQQIHALRAEVE